MAERVTPRCDIGFTVNGERRTVWVHPMARLLDVLREQLGLTGTKEGCGEGECGACAVLIDGELVNACLVPAIQVEGSLVETIEGIAADPANAALAEAFVNENAAQCGACTPGMVVAAAALLRQHPDPSEAAIREALSGNLCRCTGYVKIVDAVQSAAAQRRAS